LRLRHFGGPFRFEFQDPIPKTRAWGDDRRNEKIRVFEKMGVFQIKSQTRVLSVGKF